MIRLVSGDTHTMYFVVSTGSEGADKIDQMINWKGPFVKLEPLQKCRVSVRAVSSASYMSPVMKGTYLPEEEQVMLNRLVMK